MWLWQPELPEKKMVRDSKTRSDLNPVRPKTLLFSLAASLATMLFASAVPADTAQPINQMSDELRDSITRVVILPIAGQSGEAYTWN